MTYEWYKVFNLDEFNALNLPSRNYELDLEDKGVKNILVTKGIGVGVLFDDVFLMIDLNDKRPFTFEDKAVDVNENNDVSIGYLIEDDDEN